jgi:hypothetical protein
MWQGPTPRSANHFLKWAFVEAANVIVAHQKPWADRHVVRLYQRLKANKCHGKAAIAVARHLAESSWWILTEKQGYREPALATKSSSKNGKRGVVLAFNAVLVIAKPGAKRLMPDSRADR